MQYYGTDLKRNIYSITPFTSSPPLTVPKATISEFESNRVFHLETRDSRKSHSLGSKGTQKMCKIRGSKGMSKTGAWKNKNEDVGGFDAICDTGILICDTGTLIELARYSDTPCPICSFAGYNYIRDPHHSQEYAPTNI
ncbi:hypothetical protein J6590_062935 [Homalodisca vitripennis]|nr:hypothetical protein J6590_062935 [Homalodisca vitripennis]